MNYNNKPKPVQANLLENMMMSTQKDAAVQVSRSGGRALLLPLGRVLLMALLATATPVAVFAGASEGGMRQPDVLADTQSQATGSVLNPQQTATNAVTAQSSQSLNVPEAAPANATQASQQPDSSNTMLWLALLVLFFVILGIVFFAYKKLESGLETLRRKNAALENSVVLLNQKTSTTKIKQQQPDSFSQRQGLAERVEILEEQIRQLKPQPASAQSGIDSSDDIPLLESKLSVSKPPVSIEADDLKSLQQAFLEWRLNSRGKKLNDLLSNSFLEKIKQLEYEIVFAKAGVGLNRMIIDRKPPSDTCMVGLTRASHSLMYCHEKTSQTDGVWTPNTWYEVTIGSPDAADEQTVHKGEELPT